MIMGVIIACCMNKRRAVNEESIQLRTAIIPDNIQRNKQSLFGAFRSNNDMGASLTFPTTLSDRRILRVSADSHTHNTIAH